MSKPNLFAFAKANDADYPARLDDKLSTLSTAHRASAQDFCAAVDSHGTVSINMFSQKFQATLERGHFLSMLEYADYKVEKRGISHDEALREQGVYGPPRMAFESHFEDGHLFRYGALNIGGIGPPYYGTFCAVLKPSVVHSLPCAYFPDDSLKRYVPNWATPRVDEAATQSEAASPSSRGILATLKHAPELHSKPTTAWPQMLCRDDCYVEAVFVGEISPVSIDQIRVDNSELERLFDLFTKEKKGDIKDQDEKKAAREFVEIMKLLVKHGLDQLLVGV
ncbi:MAG TPA: hypothetical protein PK156_42570 [Polyangium sp.]|nr:hypothetical protein [Polyangium sp.]